jgi:hypothetical protein
VNDQKTKRQFWATLWNALVLNANFYETTYNTPKNRRIALIIVGLAALSHMLGSAVILIINRATLVGFCLALILDGLTIILGYYLWTFVILKIGQWIKPVDPTYGDLVSPIGIAYAPQVLNFLTLIPLLGRPIELILSVWSLLAVVVAVSQALDIKTRVAMIICLMSWIPLQIAIGFIGLVEQEIAKI